MIQSLTVIKYVFENHLKPLQSTRAPIKGKAFKGKVCNLKSKRQNKPEHFVTAHNFVGDQDIPNSNNNPLGLTKGKKC